MYTKSAEADDIMFLGWVAMDLANGRSVEGEFTGRFMIAGSGTASPRISKYAIWAVGSLRFVFIVALTNRA